MSGQSIPAARRTQVLRALGITPWVRRDKAEAAPAMFVPAELALPNSVPKSSDAVAAVICVVVSGGCSVRELDLLGRALNAAGWPLARAARLTVSKGQLAGDVPAAKAYLVFGDAQAHALGRALPAAIMNEAHIVLADELAVVLTQGEAKRRLWRAVRSLRRALGSTGG